MVFSGCPHGKKRKRLPRGRWLSLPPFGGMAVEVGLKPVTSMADPGSVGSVFPIGLPLPKAQAPRRGMIGIYWNQDLVRLDPWYEEHLMSSHCRYMMLHIACTTRSSHLMSEDTVFQLGSSVESSGRIRQSLRCPQCPCVTMSRQAKPSYQKHQHHHNHYLNRQQWMMVACLLVFIII